MKQVTALFKHGETAREAVTRLVEAKFPSDSISVLMKERDAITDIPVEQKTGVPIGMSAGGAIGAALGLTAVAAFPGLLAAGPALLALQGVSAVATGAAGGSFIGAYQGLGWWRIEADIPARAIDEGAVLVGVAVPDGRSEEARAVLRHAGADEVDAI
jgi:hypothetical protein